MATVEEYVHRLEQGGSKPLPLIISGRDYQMWRDGVIHIREIPPAGKIVARPRQGFIAESDLKKPMEDFVKGL